MGVSYSRRRERWIYDFELGGKRFNGYCLEEDGEPCTSRRAAVQAEERVRVAAGNARRSPAPMPSVGYTVAQAFAAYVGRANKASSNWGNQEDYVIDLLGFFGSETALADITETRIWDYIVWARAQKVRVYVGGPRKRTDHAKRATLWKETDRFRSDSTINRYLVTLRKTLDIAHKSRDALKRRLLEELPVVPDLAEPKALPRPIGATDIGKMLQVAAPHVADAITLSVLLGLRRTEAYGLTCDHVDFENHGIWLTAAETKGNRAEFMRANERAMEALTRLVEQARERGVDHLITWRRGKKGAWRPVKSPKTAIRTALEKAGIRGKHRFHDLKATFTTALAMKAPAKVVQRLARHRSFQTTERYIEVVDQAVRDAIDDFNDSPVARQIDVVRPEGKVPDKLPDRQKERPEIRPRKRRLSA